MTLTEEHNLSDVKILEEIRKMVYNEGYRQSADMKRILKNSHRLILENLDN